MPGVELTHVPKGLIKELTRHARQQGARLVVVHGETIVEPVEEGTNRAAIEAGVDILAHPGLITEEDVLLAKEKNVLLEITAKRGHSLSNGHVAQTGQKGGRKARFTARMPTPLPTFSRRRWRERLSQGAGLSSEDFSIMQKNALELVRKVMEAR